MYMDSYFFQASEGFRYIRTLHYILYSDITLYFREHETALSCIIAGRVLIIYRELYLESEKLSTAAESLINILL